MMAVDPVDDCTFWYTQEYYAVSGDRPWQTRIASFKLRECGNPTILYFPLIEGGYPTILFFPLIYK
jgi:hypothetical protein